MIDVDSPPYRGGIKFAQGRLRAVVLPPFSSFYVGALSVIARDPENWLRSATNHPFWQKLGELLAKGLIESEMFYQAASDVPQDVEEVSHDQSDLDSLMDIVVERGCGRLSESASPPLTSVIHY